MTRKVNSIVQELQDFDYLFNKSLNLNAANIKSLDAVALEEHLVAAKQLNPSRLMFLRREYFDLNQQTENDLFI